MSMRDGTGADKITAGELLINQAVELFSKLQQEKELLESGNIQPGNLRAVKIRRGKIDKMVASLQNEIMHASSLINDQDHDELYHLFSSIERRNQLNSNLLNGPDKNDLTVEDIASASKAINPSVVVQDGCVVDTWIGPSRPRTNIGPQGDHVTAFALIKNLAVQITKGLELDDAVRVMLFIIDHHAYDEVHDQDTISAIQDIFDKVAYMQQSSMSEEEIALTVSSVPEELQAKVLATLQRGNESLLADICNQLIAHFITQRNKRAHTAYPSQGNMLPPEDESSRVYNALNYLNDLSPDSFDLQSVVHAMRNTFWFPRIDDNTLLASDSAVWAKASSHYKKGTSPRNNELDILTRVLITHLQTILETFPLCQSTETVQAFIQSIIQDPEGAEINFNWNLDEQEGAEVMQAVYHELDLQFALSELAEQTDATSAPEDMEGFSPPGMST